MGLEIKDFVVSLGVMDYRRLGFRAVGINVVYNQVNIDPKP